MSSVSLRRASGSAFVGLIIVSAVMYGDLMGAFGDPDHVFAEHYASEANRRNDIIGAYLLAFAGLAFLVFSRTFGARAEDAPAAIWPHIAAAVGALFSGLLITAAAALSAVSLSIVFGEGFGDERPFNSGYAIVPQLGTVLLVVAAPLAAAAFILAVTFARPGLSAVDMVFGLACAVALVFGVLYIPLLALPVWVLVATMKWAH
jgi:hypothetical protein